MEEIPSMMLLKNSKAARRFTLYLETDSGSSFFAQNDLEDFDIGSLYKNTVEKK
jgi:hypothetical protein